MKLGEIQRYEILSPLCDECAGGRMEPDDTGDYVLFSDAQTKSLADERRIEELEDALGLRDADIDALSRRVGELKSDARELSQELFDGLAVYKAIPRDKIARTSAENVSDVLDAVVKLIRERRAALRVGTQENKS